MVSTEGDQSIPSELADAYGSSLRGAAPWKPGADTNAVRKRQPWRIPVSQAAPKGSPSGAQQAVRDAFEKCVDCYNKSPKTGGVEPPNIGYRSREWWYAAAGGSGLWYFDYFIQQSWSTFFGGGAPKWCGEIVTADAGSLESQPDTNYGGTTTFSIREREGEREYIYFKTDDISAPSLLTIYIYNVTYSATIEVYAAVADWDEYTLTWNNQPDAGSLLSSFYVPSGFAGWKTMSVAGHNNVTLRAQTPTVIGAKGYTRNYVNAEYRPYFT